MSEAYRQAVERLFSLQRFGIKLGLVNISRLLRLVGEPRPGKRTIIVGGTNGKGSVSTMLASISRAAGYKTGLFTSPHLVSFTERLQIDGRRISREEVVALCAQLWAALEPYRRPGEPEPITYFEMLTAMASLFFQRNDVDVAVMEVGLGGRLDATNALPRDLVVLSDIALDHQRYLGKTLASIVAEKTSLLRADVPAVAGGGVDNAAQLVAERADEIGAPLKLLARDFRFEATGDTVRFQNDAVDFSDLPTPFVGQHQRRNLAIAVQAALLLGIDNRETIVAGLAKAVWPGRLETMGKEPSWLLDCAHNPAAAQCLAAAWTPHEPTVWLLAAMSDKDFAGIIQPLAPLVSSVICTTLDMPRAASADELAAVVRRHNTRVSVKSDPDEAMAEALRQAGPQGRILVAGSIFLVGHVRGKLTGETGP